jgi:hypothetical protein
MVHICAQMTSVQTLWPACALTASEIYTCRPANDDGFGQIVRLLHSLLMQRPRDFIPPATGAGWFSRLIEVAALINRARDFLVQFQYGRRIESDSLIEKLERDLQNYQLSVAMDDLLPIRDNKLFDKSRVVYLLLSYVYCPFLLLLTLVRHYSSIFPDRITRIHDAHTG